MTCIVGLVDSGQVYIGGDSAGVADYEITVRADAKVFRNGPMIFGFTGSFRMGDLLRYRLKIPERNGPLMRYMTTTFVDAVQECLSDGGYQKCENSVKLGGHFLVGVAGRLFNICADYQVGESVDGFDAIGCGLSPALGSLFTSVGQHPRKRVITALSAAERFNAGVRRPFKIVLSKG